MKERERIGSRRTRSRRGRGFRLAALLLCLSIFLSGCSGLDIGGLFDGVLDMAGLRAPSLKETVSACVVTRYSDMTYTRPDLDELQSILDRVLRSAEEGILDDTVLAINDFYDGYNWFYTNYSLADILYSGDLSNESYAQEYDVCISAGSQVDSMLDEMYHALAHSSLLEKLEGEDYFGEGFFDDYQGESIYTEEFLDLLDQESEQISRYYALSADYTGVEDETAVEMAQTLVELIRIRQQQAKCQGYDDYPALANELYYGRDFSPEQTTAYLSAIQEKLVPLYVSQDGWSAWQEARISATEEETMNFLRGAVGNMGGTAGKALARMEAGGLYDISYSANKYNSSFEVYLTGYGEAFLFMNPTGTRYDFMTLAHEFGHYCNDFASGGTAVGIDVAEFFSQGMEYLSLSYGDAPEGLIRMKLADSLGTYVEQGCFAAFEQKLYDLSAEDLTVEGLRSLYMETAASFGFDERGTGSLEFVSIPHFYTKPMYIISYVVSNDAAMQLYEMEDRTPGEGLRCMTEQLDTDVVTFMAFLDSAGLKSPFERVDQVAAFFAENP